VFRVAQAVLQAFVGLLAQVQGFGQTGGAVVPGHGQHHKGGLVGVQAGVEHPALGIHAAWPGHAGLVGPGQMLQECEAVVGCDADPGVTAQQAGQAEGEGGARLVEQGSGRRLQGPPLGVEALEEAACGVHDARPPVGAEFFEQPSLQGGRREWGVGCHRSVSRPAQPRWSRPNGSAMVKRTFIAGRLQRPMAAWTTVTRPVITRWATGHPRCVGVAAANMHSPAGAHATADRRSILLALAPGNGLG
jgi:hypothetical protein